MLHCPLPAAAVASAEPVYIRRVSRAPSDPYYPEADRTSGMWHLRKARAAAPRHAAGAAAAAGGMRLLNEQMSKDSQVVLTHLPSVQIFADVAWDTQTGSK